MSSHWLSHDMPTVITAFGISAIRLPWLVVAWQMSKSHSEAQPITIDSTHRICRQRSSVVAPPASENVTVHDLKTKFINQSHKEITQKYDKNIWRYHGPQLQASPLVKGEALRVMEVVHLAAAELHRRCHLKLHRLPSLRIDGHHA